MTRSAAERGRRGIRIFLEALSCAVILAVCLSGHARSGSWQGKVVGVADGDTITVLRESQSYS